MQPRRWHYRLLHRWIKSFGCVISTSGDIPPGNVVFHSLMMINDNFKLPILYVGTLVATDWIVRSTGKHLFPCSWIGNWLKFRGYKQKFLFLRLLCSAQLVQMQKNELTLFYCSSLKKNGSKSISRCGQFIQVNNLYNFCIAIFIFLIQQLFFPHGRTFNSLLYKF